MALKTSFYCKGRNDVNLIEFNVETLQGLRGEYVVKLYKYFGPQYEHYETDYEKFGSIDSMKKMIMRLRDEMDCFEKDDVSFLLESNIQRVEMHISNNRLEFRSYLDSVDYCSLSMPLKNNRSELIKVFDHLINLSLGTRQ